MLAVKKLPTMKPKTTAAMRKEDGARVSKLFGERMRYARAELCKISQVDAAMKLGYSNSSKLSKIEGSLENTPPQCWLLMAAADIYDVSTDFLLGRSDDWEHDPVVSQERQIGHWLFSHWERARNSEVNAIRVLCNRITAVERAISFGSSWTTELSSIVHSIRSTNKDFDNEIKFGAKLINFAINAAEEQAGISAELKRFHAYVDVADKSANVKLRNRDIFEEQQ